MPVTIVLADDHPVVREGIRMLLEREKFEIVGEAADGLELVRLAEKHQPDVAVLDLSMPNMNGLTAMAQVAKVSPRTKCVLLTMYAEEHHILEALRAGAKAFVLKTQAAQHLLLAIREVSLGGVYLSPTVSGAVVPAYLAKLDLPHDPLTARERQVLQLVAEGKRTKEIALILGMTAKTAETHRVKVMEKLDIHSTAGLVHYAIRRGMVTP
jgi:two-component system, NarL family, response regulator NreC